MKNAFKQDEDLFIESIVRLIAEEGLSYGEAKLKIAKQLRLKAHVHLPDNTVLEAALRDYLALFYADTHPQELRRLRELACVWLERISDLMVRDSDISGTVYAVGAVVNGTATHHSPIHLQCFTQDSKHLEIALINEGYVFEITQHDINGMVCTALVFQDKGIPIVLTVRTGLVSMKEHLSHQVINQHHCQVATLLDLRKLLNTY